MCKTARLTSKQVSAPVARRDISAARAAFARVARVNLDHRHAAFFSLVLDEEHQLPVSPAVDFGPLGLPQAPLANAVELFDREDRAPGLFSKTDDGATDFVIDGLHEPRLSAGQPFQQPAHGMRRMLCLFPLESGANMQVAVTRVLGMPAPAPIVASAIRRSGKHIDSAVDADDSIVRRSLFRNLLFKRQHQKYFATAHQKATVAEGPIVEFILQVRRARERDGFTASAHGPERQAGRSQRHVAAAFAALQDDRLVPEQARAHWLDAIRAHRRILRSDVPDARLSDLGRQSAPSSRSVGQGVQSHRIRYASGLKSDAAHGVAGFRPSRDSLPRHVERQRNLQFGCTNDFRHRADVSVCVGIFKRFRPSGRPPFLCRLKAAVPRRML
jgi:hypothetical protein